MTIRILICDDEQDFSKEIATQLEAVMDKDIFSILTPPTPEEITTNIEILLDRQTSIREGTEHDTECIFDQADILVVDYDLEHVGENKARFTGEGVARLVRVFSKAGTIILLNQFPEADFDLGMRGHLQSFADINIAASQVDSPRLWLGEKGDFFHSHWSDLKIAFENQKARSESLKDALSDSIIDTLGFDDEDALRMSDNAFGFIAPEAKNLEELKAVTFENFISQNPASVREIKDGPPLLEADIDAAVRVCAARISKWMKREVLGPLDILVDIPHLLQRYPFLMRADSKDVKNWLEVNLFDISSVIEGLAERTWFQNDIWLDRPAVWLSRLEADAVFQKAKSEFDYSELPDVVYCEDTFTFVSFDEAKEFRADFHNSHDRRYVKDLKDVAYAPQRRFAFGG